MNNKILVLFACCIPVKGFQRSIIYDLQRKQYFFIPNSLFQILDKYRDKTVFEIKQLFSEEEQSILENYISFLVRNEIAFLCESGEEVLFPAINMRRESPFVIENFIIDSDKDSNHDFEKILNELSDLDIRILQMRFFSEVPVSEIKQLLNCITQSNIRNLELILPVSKEIDQKFWFSVIQSHKKLGAITLCNSDHDAIRNYEQCTIISCKKEISSEQECGIIDKGLFSCNKDLFMEAQTCNTCLNRKLSVDKDGNIKNCPSMQKSFGNIEKVSLKKVINDNEFRSLWGIKKDSVEICKDCEFRYMCTDCRAYLKDPLNLFSQPKNCKYNPYIAKWEGEDGYVPVEEEGWL